MSHDLERKSPQGEPPKAATLELSVTAVGMGLRFVELEQTELVNSVTCLLCQNSASGKFWSPACGHDVVMGTSGASRQIKTTW